MKQLKFFILLAAVIGFASCSKDDDAKPSYKSTSIPQEVSDLYIAKGDLKSETAYLYIQGGPVFNLDSEDLDELLPDANALKVYVHQAQTLNPKLKTQDLNLEQAVKENNVSIEILHKVIKHFKSLNKKVVVISHSFGSFITPKYIEKYGNDADAMCIMAGRIDMPDVVWQAFRDGKIYVFKDGKDPVPMKDTPEEFDNKTSKSLAAALGQYRFSKLLAEKDLSKVLYVYGDKDEEVGSLSKEEVSFLTSKKVTVMGIENGEHGDMFEDPIAPGIMQEIAKIVAQK
eukprot:TRINITY_DN258_c3_g1_i1.p2 TRINITY_DN258_c3_g1~~TRINITY_DN258_c3_g1_i1.p2  ORF type:complete len:286 (-),score=29.78 TRINITY_DN258_c3_g1_i1:1231-2088(-)